MAKRWVAVVGLAAIVAFATACASKSTSLGGGDNNTSQPAQTSAQASKGGGGGPSVLTVKQQASFTFAPAKFTVKSGDTITVKNDSGFLHTFTIDGQGINQQVTGGQSAKVAIGIPAGKYTFYCMIHGTPTSGMRGQVTVT